MYERTAKLTAAKKKLETFKKQRANRGMSTTVSMPGSVLPSMPGSPSKERIKLVEPQVDADVIVTPVSAEPLGQPFTAAGDQEQRVRELGELLVYERSEREKMRHRIEELTNQVQAQDLLNETLVILEKDKQVLLADKVELQERIARLEALEVEKLNQRLESLSIENEALKATLSQAVSPMSDNEVDALQLRVDALQDENRKVKALNESLELERDQLAAAFAEVQENKEEKMEDAQTSPVNEVGDNYWFSRLYEAVTYFGSIYDTLAPELQSYVDQLADVVHSETRLNYDQGQFDVLLHENNQLKQQVDSLQADVSDKDTRILELDAENQLLRKNQETLNQSINEDYQSLQKKVSELEAENETLLNEVSRMKQEFDDIMASRATLDGPDQKQENSEEELADLRAQLVQAQMDLEEVQQESENLKNEHQREVDALNERLSGLETDFRDRDEVLGSLRNELGAVEEEKRRKEEEMQLKIDELNEKIAEKEEADGLQDEIARLQGVVEAKESEVSGLCGTVEELQEKIAQVELAKEMLSNELKEAQKQMKEAKGATEEATTKLFHLGNHFKGLQSQYQQALAARQADSEQIEMLDREKNKLLSEKVLLLEEKDELEQMKILLEQEKGQLEEEKNLVLNEKDVAQQELERIRQELESTKTDTQVLVESLKDVKDMNSELKHQLEVIKNDYEIKEQQLQMRYANLQEQYEELSQQNEELNHLLMEKSGSMDAFAAELHEAQQAELAQKDGVIQSLQEELGLSRKELDELNREVEDLKREREDILGRLELLERELGELNRELEESQKEREEINGLRNEVDELKRETLTLQQENTSLKHENSLVTDQMEKERHELKEQLEETNKNYNERVSYTEQVTMNHNTLYSHYEELQAQYTAATEELQESRALVDETRDLVKQKEARIEELLKLEQEQGSLQDRISELKEQIAQKELQMSHLQQDIDTARAEKHELHEKVARLEAEIASLERENALVTQEHQQNEARLGEIQAERDELVARVEEQKQQIQDLGMETERLMNESEEYKQIVAQLEDANERMRAAQEQERNAMLASFKEMDEMNQARVDEMKLMYQSTLEEKQALEAELSLRKQGMDSLNVALEETRAANQQQAQMLEQSEAQMQEKILLTKKLLDDLARIEAQLLEASNARDREQFRCRELEENLLSVTAQHDEAVSLSSQKDEQIMQLKNELDQIQRELETAKGQADVQATLEKDLETVSKMLHTLMQENQRLLHEVNEVGRVPRDETMSLAYDEVSGVAYEGPRDPDRDLSSHLIQLWSQVTKLMNAFETNCKYSEKLQMTLRSVGYTEAAALVKEHLRAKGTLVVDLKRTLNDIDSTNRFVLKTKTVARQGYDEERGGAASIAQFTEQLSYYCDLVFSLTERRDHLLLSLQDTVHPMQLEEQVRIIVQMLRQLEKNNQFIGKECGYIKSLLARKRETVLDTAMARGGAASTRFDYEEEHMMHSFNSKEYADIMAKLSHTEGYRVQFESAQALIKEHSTEIESLKNALEGITASLGQSGTKAAQRQIDELRKVWAQELSANAVLRHLIAETQRKFAKTLDDSRGQQSRLRQEFDKIRVLYERRKNLRI